MDVSNQNGSVGIGITIPGAKFDVSDNSNTCSNNSFINLQNQSENKESTFDKMNVNEASSANTQNKISKRSNHVRTTTHSHIQNYRTRIQTFLKSSTTFKIWSMI
jgi:hypothetical protein